MELDLAEEYAQRVSAPEANAFEFHSQGVVDMMQKLKDKFQDERTSLEKDEASSRHNFQMLMQDLQAQSASAEEARGSKATAKAKKLQAVADTRADLQDTTATRDDDSKYLGDTTATCELKASDFQSRQSLRADE